MLSSGVIILSLVFFMGTLTGHYASPIDSTNVRADKTEYIRRYMNLSQDPCDNFYEYACGNWATANPATKEEKKTSFSAMGAKEYVQKIAMILSSFDKTDTDNLKTVKEFYISCVQRSQDLSVYRPKLLEIVNEFGKMPVLESWQASSFDWLKVIGQIAFKYNKNILLGFSIRPELQYNRTVNRLVLRHFNYPLGSLAYYLNEANEKYRIEYRNEIAEDLREFLGLEPQVAEETAHKIVNLEVNLVKGAERGTVTGGEMASSTSLDELQKKYAQRLDVKRLLELSLGAVPNWMVSERVPSYQENLISLLNSTASDTVANYVFYNLLRHFFVHLRKPKISLQDDCIQSTRLNFYPLVENTMYQQLNVAKSEEDIRKLFTDIKTQFQNVLASDSYPWISKDTRLHGIEKLNVMLLEIDSFQNVNFTQKFGGIHTTPQDFIENLKSVYAKDAMVTRSKVNTPPTPLIPSEIEKGPRYSLYSNRVYIPIVKLMPHYYWSTQLPNVVNYAQLGVLLAHEIVHAFDYKGQQFDAAGTSSSWWDKKSKNEFETRSQCLVNQYKNYSYGGKQLTTDKDQAENIADNGGIRLAYEAYMVWFNSEEDHQAVHKKEELLPHLNYSIPQLFFIIYAQQYCTDTYPFYMDEVTTTDLHAPGNLRVMGALTNFDKFSAAFNCPPESSMNPKRKCIIF